ncbi:MAG TPA: VCBS repeat-containing protein [Miltoncostaea sp.]|nr:VCBS repeat-containing protein [Miltoncostaea sp.]
MGTIRTPRGLGRAARAAALAFVATGGTLTGAHAALAADVGYVAGPTAPVPEVRSLAVGDFDRDGTADVAATNLIGRSVRILIGGRDGFTPRADVPVGSGPVQVEAVDVDRNGTDDLAVLNQGDGDVSIRVNDGTGAFTAPSPDVPAGTTPFGMAVHDFDADGRDDLLIGSGTGDAGRVGLWLGYENTLRIPLYSDGGVLPYIGGPVVAADLTEDGLADEVVCGIPATVGCRVEIGLPGAKVKDGPTFTLPDVAPFPRILAIGDVDGDGHLDVAAATKAGLIVRYGDGTGALRAGPTLAIGGDPIAVAAADLDDDGRDDLVTAAYSGQVRVHLSRAGGGFVTRPTVATPGVITDLGLGDFDGDGVTDIAVAGADRVRVLRGTRGPTRPGNLVVNGDFEAGVTSVNGAYPVVQGWQQRGLATLIPYGFTSPLFTPSRQDAPRFGGGERLLWGGSSQQGNAPSVFQDIDLGRSAAAIDAGRATATLSAWLGGARTYPDHAYVTAAFTPTKGSEDALATVKVGPVGPKDRHNLTTLVRREASATVPRGARCVRVTVQTVDADDTLSSATADNVVLTVAVPQPRADGGGGPGGGVAGRAAFGRRTLVTLALLRGRPIRVRVRNANGFAVTGRLLGAGAPRRFRVAAHRTATVRLQLRSAHPRSLRLRARVTDPSGTTRTVVRRVRLLPARHLVRKGGR